MDVLLIEDDASFAFSIADYLADRGYTVTAFREGLKGVEEAQKGYGCILLDLGLPDIDGMLLIPQLREAAPRTPLIVMTGRDDASTAVGAMKAGAYDYLTKPVDLEELALILQRVGTMVSLEDKISYMEAKEEFVLLGKSRPLEEIRSLITKVAPHATPVLVVGETGAGKEVVARLIHKASGRRGNFVDINCSAIPQNLFEGELFGFKAGAFTGATQGKKGLVQLADGGTLFLDEVGDLPPDLQPKLLRVLEQGEVRPLGESKNARVDVRIIAATNNDSEAMLTQGRLRHDLYFRLSAFLVLIPPLRERKEDIPILADYFLREFSQRMRKNIEGFAPETRDIFLNYPWPGNIRELKNVIERGVIMCDGSVIKKKHLPMELQHKPREKEIAPLQEIEKEHISTALRRCQGNISQAAKALQMPRTTLRDRIRDLGISYKP
jgi:DNA-binding NtrC family response regulator